jgi:hypothetical protein
MIRTNNLIQELTNAYHCTTKWFVTYDRTHIFINLLSKLACPGSSTEEIVAVITHGMESARTAGVVSHAAMSLALACTAMAGLVLDKCLCTTEILILTQSGLNVVVCYPRCQHLVVSSNPHPVVQFLILSLGTDR